MRQTGEKAYVANLPASSTTNPPTNTNQEPDNDAVLMNWIEEMPFIFMTDLDSSHVLANTLSHNTTNVDRRPHRSH